MGRIFCLMGKSAVGKDTIFKVLQEDFPQIKSVIMYTTRPIRENEKNGQEYFFVDQEERKRLEAEGKVIECQPLYLLISESPEFGCRPCF